MVWGFIILCNYPEFAINRIAENCSAHVTGLRCAQARIILAVILGTMSPNKIG